MSGGNISYHLRPNKFVERSLFIDLLRIVCPKAPKDYLYISMGGPQLEDHRQIHYQLEFENLLSIESDPVIYERQCFNKRPACIECRNISTEELIADFVSIDEQYPTQDYIIWLDYAAANKRYEQLGEFQSLLSTLNVGDIIKLTINANPTSLCEKHAGESSDELQKRRFDILKGQLQEYLSQDYDYSDLTRKGFLKILCSSIEIAILRGLDGTDKPIFLPILSFTYQDGPHLMLNVAIKLYENEEQRNKEKELLQKKWSFFTELICDTKLISVPDLTIKERIYLESKFYSDSEEAIHDEMPFNFVRNKEESLNILKQYFQHYRRYPGYHSITI